MAKAKKRKSGSKRSKRSTGNRKSAAPPAEKGFLESFFEMFAAVPSGGRKK